MNLLANIYNETKGIETVDFCSIDWVNTTEKMESHIKLYMIVGVIVAIDICSQKMEWVESFELFTLDLTITFFASFTSATPSLPLSISGSKMSFVWALGYFPTFSIPKKTRHYKNKVNHAWIDPCRRWFLARFLFHNDYCNTFHLLLARTYSF